MEWKSLFESYGITISNYEQMQNAFTHTSYANEQHTGNYERLEFLGDAVLELITSEYFY